MTYDFDALSAAGFGVVLVASAGSPADEAELLGRVGLSPGELPALSLSRGRVVKPAGLAGLAPCRCCLLDGDGNPLCWAFAVCLPGLAPSRCNLFSSRLLWGLPACCRCWLFGPLGSGRVGLLVGDSAVDLAVPPELVFW